jgi:hypothetical protein
MITTGPHLVVVKLEGLAGVGRKMLGRTIRRLSAC